MSRSTMEANARAFFTAMNTQDPDAATSLARTDVEIAFGPNRFTGHAALRDLATQRHAELTFETSPLSFEPDGDSALSVEAERVQRWRSNGEVAAVEELRARFTFDSDGSIARIQLS